MKFHCSTCKAPYPDTGIPITCPACSGVFTARLDPIEPDLFRIDYPGIWKYQHFLGLPDNAPVIHLGEGHTPIITVPGGKQIFAKMENLNPTGSFKDRGAALFTSLLVARNIQEAIDDSSGNAGAAFAAYAATANIKARVYVPAAASGPKLDQMTHSGADIRRIDGPRSAASTAAWEAIENEGLSYASHNYLPYCLSANATIAYEIVEQLGDAPGAMIIPIGHGNLFLGIHHGFQALLAGGVIEKVPVLMGVQAANCAPLRTLFDSSINEVAEGETHAEGIRIIKPLRWNELKRTIEDNDYPVHFIEEDAILSGHASLAKKGLNVEKTSAVVWDALRKNVDKLPKPVVLLISGHGLKNDPL